MLCVECFTVYSSLIDIENELRQTSRLVYIYNIQSWAEAIGHWSLISRRMRVPRLSTAAGDLGHLPSTRGAVRAACQKSNQPPLAENPQPEMRGAHNDSSYQNKDDHHDDDRRIGSVSGISEMRIFVLKKRLTLSFAHVFVS